MGTKTDFLGLSALTVFGILHGRCEPCSHALFIVQTVEPREVYYNRSMGAIKAGGNFIMTSFPDVAQLPTFAYSVKGSSNATYTTYTVSPWFIMSHPLRHPPPSLW